jgi:CDP-Glycerol:Poly(glycerophosphate) glycerophosphotransferase
MGSSNAGVLILTVFDWHRAILDPLINRFREWRDVDYETTNNILMGWRPRTQPHLVIVCDAGAVHWLRKIFPQSLFMHVGHGLISKNETSYHYREPDFICVASQHVVDRLVALGHVPRQQFFATGLIQTDPLFQHTEISNRAEDECYDSSVIYAPTWNEALTSAAIFGDKLVPLIRGQNERMRIFIKPHPHISVVRPDWIEMWHDISLKNVNVILCEAESDLIPLLLDSDLMVSDSSSAIFHFLALNRPIVLVNNPQRFGDSNAYDPNGIEWQWRDIAEEVEDIQDLAAAVQRELNAPKNRSELRTKRQFDLFGDLTDGQSCERVHSAAVHLLQMHS